MTLSAASIAAISLGHLARRASGQCIELAEDRRDLVPGQLAGARVGEHVSVESAAAWCECVIGLGRAVDPDV